LAQYNINSLIAELNKEIGSYIKTAGIGTRNDQTYTNIIKLTSRIEYIKNVYATLHHDIIEFISKESSPKANNFSSLEEKPLNP
jgi:thiamine pyrophosphokinase